MALVVEKPVRWSQPFGADMTEADVDWLLQIPPFSQMDQERFPGATPLRGILRNDTRIRDFAPGDILVRKGDYGGSAFLVLDGELRVILAGEEEEPDRPPIRRRNWFSALSQLWSNPAYAEVRRDLGRDIGINVRQAADARDAQLFIDDPGAVIATANTVELGRGSLIGEIGALTRSPRENTVFAETSVQALEIRFQGLREMRRYDAGFRDYVDKLYRDRSLAIRLRALPMFRDFPPDRLSAIMAVTQFETFGDTTWHVDFHRMADLSPAERLRREPIIVNQGDFINDLFVMGFGFARVGVAAGDATVTARFLRSGDLFGFDEIIANWRDGGQRGYGATLRAIGYVDVLHIPVKAVEEHILPHLAETGGTRGAGVVAVVHDGSAAESAAELDQGFLEFMVERRFMNGRAAMVIDVEKCVRCDECVRACAVAHGNNPRFVRHGPHYASIQIANACMHCVDAVCLLGCPTGAIHREPEFGRVVINDQTCIGCATCASSCTYHNIRMVEIRDEYGNPVLEKETLKPVVKATKCDLCLDQPSGPACQRACPHDALHRMDLSEFTTIAELARQVADQ